MARSHKLENCFERPLRLKAEVDAARTELCLSRARSVTEFFRSSEGRKGPLVVRKSKALARILEERPANIYPGELIVGAITSKRLGALFYPELGSLSVARDLAEMNRRAVNPIHSTRAERLEVLTRIAPFWAPRSVETGSLLRARRPNALFLSLSEGLFVTTEHSGVAHIIPDYGRVLRDGLCELANRAAEGARNCSKVPARRENLAFYEAVVIACRAVERFAERHAEEAERQAAAEKAPGRRAELLEIARVCRKVPGRPAGTFREALQSIWLTHAALLQESQEQGMSLGRLDRLLGPYYEADLAAGRISREGALELLGCYFVKSCEVSPFYDRRKTDLYGGLPVGQAITIGGVDREGRDAVNEASYLILETLEALRTRQPNVQARISRENPDRFVRACARVIRGGGGMPALFADETVVPALEALGVAAGDAREYGVIGCTEPAPAGCSYPSSDAGLLNLPVCVEWALNRGRSFGAPLRLGAATADPRRMVSFDDVVEAFRLQVRRLVGAQAATLAAEERANRELHPTPLASALVGGALESGVDITGGGARYNFSGVQAVGLADAADSLTAIRQVVFEEKRLSLPELVGVLKNNFKGREELRQHLLNKVPKYGNDDPAADGAARLVARIWCEEVGRLVNTRGGRFIPGFYSMTCHRVFGRRTGALPSGRRAGEPFADGVGPADGVDRRGPTAALASASRIDYRLAANGCTLNQKFDAETLSGERGAEALAALFRGFFELGGLQLQVNVVDHRTLVDARDNPGKYPGLLVRVSGYSAYFDDLAPEVKDEIINRTRQRLG